MDLLTESYRLRTDAALHTAEDGALSLRQSRFQLAMDGLTVGARAMVLRLAQGWASDVELTETVTGIDGIAGALAGQLLLRRLAGHSWLQRRLGVADRELVASVPRGLGAAARPQPVKHREGARYRLSRFAVLHADDAELVAETPLSTLGVALLDPAVAAAVALPSDVDEFARLAGIAPGMAGMLLDELLTARVLVDEQEAQAERESMPMAAWSPVDLWFHHRSRAGRHVQPLGGTFPLRGVAPPLPLRHEHPHAPQVELPVPDLEVAAKEDGSLTELVTQRRSVREHGAEPLTREALAEFLYRVQHQSGARVVGDQEVGDRPYPAGGALCELEIYPVVHRCAGLDAGIYHYDSTHHRLARLAAPGAESTTVLRYAQAAATMSEPPQVCLVVTARVGRIMWKYEGMAYALLLKHAGVLTELMYLVATAMGLAPCAIGTGDSAAFAAATGIDPLTEPSVGEFVLGSSR